MLTMGFGWCFFASFPGERYPIEICGKTIEIVSKHETLKPPIKFSCHEKAGTVTFESETLGDEIKRHIIRCSEHWDLRLQYLNWMDPAGSSWFDVNLFKLRRNLSGTPLPFCLNDKYVAKVEVPTPPITYSEEEKDRVLKLGYDIARGVRPTRMGLLDSVNFDSRFEFELWLVYYQNISTLAKVACEVYGKKFRELSKTEEKQLVEIAKENSYKLELINDGLFILSSGHPADYPRIKLPHKAISEFFE